MKIDRLHLDRYGVFFEKTLNFQAGAHLHVVFGANEAGKTSALNAVGDLLFGFPERTAYDFLHEASTLRVAARLRFADGATMFLRRRKGRKHTLADEHNKPLVEGRLSQALGPLTRGAFFAEFGLTAPALREGGRDLLMAGGRLSDSLTAASARLNTLARLRREMQERADELFTMRRSSSRSFYSALSRRDAADQKFRDAIVDVSALAAADNRIADARKKRDALEERRAEISRDIARRERARRTRGKLERLGELRAELARLADPASPTHIPAIDAAKLAVWRLAEEERAAIQRELAGQEGAQTEAAAARKTLFVDEALLEAASAIEALRERRGAARKAEEDLPRRSEVVQTTRTELFAAARRLGRRSERELIEDAPAEAAIAHARELIVSRRTAERRLAEALETEAALASELRSLEPSAGPGAASQEGAPNGGNAARMLQSEDPAPWATRLAALDDILAESERLRQETQRLEQEERDLAEEAARLDPSAGSLDELAQRALPDPGMIESARQSLSALDRENGRIEAEQAASLQRLALCEQEIGDLTSAGDIATRDDLAKGREERDQAYRVLADSIMRGDTAMQRDNFMALVEKNVRLDRITDLLLADAARAARLEAAQEAQFKEQRAQKLFALEESDLAAKREAERRLWRGLWTTARIEPKSPEQMAAWLARASAILARRAGVASRRPAWAALTKKLEEHRAALTQIIKEMDKESSKSLGEDADVAAPIEALYKRARATVDRLQAEWTERRAAEALFQRAQRSLSEAQAARAQREEAAQAARASWAAAMEALGLAPDKSIGDAEDALEIFATAAKLTAQLRDEERRILAMRNDIVAFEKDVRSFVAAKASDLAERPLGEALDALLHRLEQAKAARERRAALDEAAEKRETARQAIAQRIVAPSRIAAEARAALGLAADASLAPIFSRFTRREQLEKDIDDELRNLREAGDGLEESALRVEQADLDPEMLAKDIERLRASADEVDKDLETAATALYEAKRERQTLEAGRDAGAAAHERAESEAELLTVARRWLERAGAARLAARAVERHRAATQDPLLARASQLFLIVTDGSFEGLVVDYDDKDQPTLVGLRAGGVKVEVPGMSEGTRDQLFLSLRLAMIELRSGEALPFIGDDLLASFDDRRAARAIELLAEFGRSRQTILFTHHRSVVEIAVRMNNARVDIIEL